MVLVLIALKLWLLGVEVLFAPIKRSAQIHLNSLSSKPSVKMMAVVEYSTKDIRQVINL